MIGNQGFTNDYDVIIRTQSQFTELISSSTWLNAKSVLFVGDGGNLKFSKTDGALAIPDTVYNIAGVNKAIISVTDINAAINNVALKYVSGAKTDAAYSISDITLEFATNMNMAVVGFNGFVNMMNCHAIFPGPYGSPTSFSNCRNLTNCSFTAGRCLSIVGGYSNCTNLINCSASASEVVQISSCFNNCMKLENCVAEMACRSSVYGFQSCENLVNCRSGVRTISNVARAYESCKSLVNCQGTALIVSTLEETYQVDPLVYADEDPKSCYSFYSCSYLNNCRLLLEASTSGFLGGSNTKVDTLTVVAS